jgi:hypothetical protein
VSSAPWLGSPPEKFDVFPSSKPPLLGDNYQLCLTTGVWRNVHISIQPKPEKPHVPTCGGYHHAYNLIPINHRNAIEDSKQLEELGTVFIESFDECWLYVIVRVPIKYPKSNGFIIILKKQKTTHTNCMKLQVSRGSISSIPYFQTPQVFLCSLTTLVTRASRNDMVMRRPSQKLWVPEAHFLLKLVGKSCQPTAWNPETRQLESKLTLTILRTLDDVFFWREIH